MYITIDIPQDSLELALQHGVATQIERYFAAHNHVLILSQNLFYFI